MDNNGTVTVTTGNYGATNTITNLAVNGQVVTVTTSGTNGFQSGQTVLISGAPTGDNGAYPITPVSGQPTMFTYTVPNGTTPVAGTAGYAVAFTPAPSSFTTNQQVQLSGLTDVNGNSVYNGVYTVTGTGTNSFTFSTTLGLATGYGGEADLFTGLPLSITVPTGFGSNVTSASFILTYDPTQLTVSAAAVTGGFNAIGSGSTVTLTPARSLST